MRKLTRAIDVDDMSTVYLGKLTFVINPALLNSESSPKLVPSVQKEMNTFPISR